MNAYRFCFKLWSEVVAASAPGLSSQPLNHLSDLGNLLEVSNTSGILRMTHAQHVEKSLSLVHQFHTRARLCPEGAFAYGIVSCVFLTSVGFPMRWCWNIHYSRFSILSPWACCYEMGQLIFCIKHFRESSCPDLQFCRVFIGKKVSCVFTLSQLCCV